MPIYSYKAKNEYGQTVRGILAANNVDELTSILDEMNLYLVSAKESKFKAPITLFERIKRSDLIMATIHLATVLGAGVSIVHGLEDLERQTEKHRFREIIADIRRSIQAGASLSDALARHPDVFSDLYVSIVKAGEATGNVEEVLRDLVSFMEWQEELSSQVKQMTIYPAFILTAVSLLIILLMTFVFPRFTVIFEKTGAPLPLPTRIVMAFSHFFSSYWWVLIISLVGLVIFQRVFVRTPQGKFVWDQLKLRIPIFGELLKKVALSRFSHYLATLLRAGVDIVYSLEVVERVVDNAVIARVVRECRDRVVSGDLMSDSLSRSGHFPPLVVRMIAIGESTGNMEETLGKVSEYYDREVPATLKKVFAIFEPLVIGILALIVLLMALSMFLPLYQMISLVGKM